MTELTRAICREICAVKGEPPCWQLPELSSDAGPECLQPCDVCEAVAALFPQWQPIKTAPKCNIVDGHGPRVLLGWSNYQTVAIARDEPAGWRDGYGGACIKPTHWQPLPNPPTAGEGG